MTVGQVCGSTPRAQLGLKAFIFKIQEEEELVTKGPGLNGSVLIVWCIHSFVLLWAPLPSRRGTGR